MSFIFLFGLSYYKRALQRRKGNVSFVSEANVRRKCFRTLQGRQFTIIVCRTMHLPCVVDNCEMQNETEAWADQVSMKAEPESDIVVINQAKL